MANPIKNGDKVIFSKPEANIYDEVGVVDEANPTDEFQLYYFGEGHIVVERENGELIAVQKNDYRQYIEEDEIGISDIVTLKASRKDMKRLFYPVISIADGDIVLCNDRGNNIRFMRDEVEKVSLSNWLEYMINLDDKLYRLENLLTNTMDLVQDDINNSLRSYKL